MIGQHVGFEASPPMKPDAEPPLSNSMRKRARRALLIRFSHAYSVI